MALTETYHAGEFLLNEAASDRSREEVTLLSGSTLNAGAVLGQALIDVTDVTGAADAGNTGGGTIGTLSAGTGVQVGDYHALCVEPASGGGIFFVFDPKNNAIGKAVVGTEFSGEIVFTISDGDPDFAAGDIFTITVGAGSGKYEEYNPANADGSNKPKGILFAATDASEGDVNCVAIVRDAVVKRELLQWFDEVTEDQKNAAIDALKDLGIVVRGE